MNKFIALTRIQLKDFFSKYTQQMNIKNKALAKLMVFVPILILLPLIMLVKRLYDTFFMVGMPELTLTYAYVLATMFVFIGAVPLVVSVYFYAKDLTLIATLPVGENAVVFSKLAAMYVYLETIAFSLFGIGVAFYALADGFKPMSLLLGILVTLLLPLMPMIFAVLVILPFMNFVGGRKKRNLIVILGNVLLLACIIGIQMVVTRVETDPSLFMELVMKEDGLMNLVGSKFPPSVWATKMVMGSWFESLAFIGINVLFVLVLRIASRFLYQSALTKYNQVSATVSKGKITYKSSSKRMLLIKRHIGIIVNNPTFLLNTVLTILLPILMIVIYVATGQFDLEMLKDPSLEPFMIFIFAGVISTPALVGSLSATVITREGKTFWETRVLPISVEDNLRSRIDSSLVIYFAGSLVLGVLSAIVMPLSVMDILVSALLCVAVSFCFSMMDLIINIQRPFLNWSNPTAAVKNNLNIMISLLFRVIIGFVGFGIYKNLPTLSPYSLILIFTVYFILLSIASYILVFGRYKTKFTEMEI